MSREFRSAAAAREEQLWKYWAKVTVEPPGYEVQWRTAAEVLPIKDWRRDFSELQWVAEDEGKLTTLLELSRMYVDGVKTASARAISPGAALYYLSELVDGVEVIYLNPAVREGIARYTPSLDLMRVEMSRDMVKGVRDAGVPFYSGAERENLLRVASEISEQSIKKMERPNTPEEKALMALLTIEEQVALSNASKLARWDIVTQALPEFIAGYTQGTGRNYDRVAAVLTTLKAREWEIRLFGSSRDAEIVSDTYQEHVAGKSRYQEDLHAEGMKLRLRRVKNMVLPVMSSGSPIKGSLYERMLKWGERK